MNVPQITIPRDEARRKLAAVRAQLHRRADAEYAQLEVAYRAAAEGKTLVMLSDALRTAERDAKGRPRIAIARADRTQVRLSGSMGSATYTAIGRGGSFWGSGRRLIVRVPAPDVTMSMPHGYAVVPMIPPDVRGRHALDTHFVLWEVETWADRAVDERPDRDPLLLTHLGGDLYAVLASWDLTTIERAIMAGRAGN